MAPLNLLVLLFTMMTIVLIPPSLAEEETPKPLSIISHEGFQWKSDKWLRMLPNEPIPAIEPGDIPQPEIRSFIERLNSPDEEVRGGALKELNVKSQSGIYDLSRLSTSVLSTNIDADPEDEYIIFLNPGNIRCGPILVIYDLQEAQQGQDSSLIPTRRTITFDDTCGYYGWHLTARDLTGDGAAEIIFHGKLQTGNMMGLEYLEILKGVNGKIRTVFFAILNYTAAFRELYNAELSERVVFAHVRNGLYDINLHARFWVMEGKIHWDEEKEDWGVKALYEFEGEGSARYRWDPEKGAYIVIHDDRDGLRDPAAPGEAFEYDAQRRWVIESNAVDPTWDGEK